MTQSRTRGVSPAQTPPGHVGSEGAAERGTQFEGQLRMGQQLAFLVGSRTQSHQRQVRAAAQRPDHQAGDLVVRMLVAVSVTT